MSSMHIHAGDGEIFECMFDLVS